MPIAGDPAMRHRFEPGVIDGQPRHDRQMDALPEVLSLHQVAEALDCSVRTVRRLIAGGDLRASQITRRGGWVVQRGDLFAFLDDRATAKVRPVPVLPTVPSRPAATTHRFSSDGRLSLPTRRSA